MSVRTIFFMGSTTNDPTPKLETPGEEHSFWLTAMRSHNDLDLVTAGSTAVLVVTDSALQLV